MNADQTPTPYTGLDRMTIGGEWRHGSSGEVHEDVDPYDDMVLAEIHLADAGDVDLAYRAAERAWPVWAETPASERAEVFRRALRVFDARRTEIVDWLVREAGAVRDRAEFEWGLVRSGMAEAASYPTRVEGRILPGLTPGKENRVYREPLGVVTVISPWNFPLQLSHRSVAPAIALGNTVVLKPAENTPVTGGILLARIYEEAGLPPGVLNVVLGKGGQIGDALATHESSRMVSFTGSTDVGRHISRLIPLKRRALELGGNCPVVVLDDADLDLAADAAVFGSYYHQGQICMATNRIIATTGVHDELVDRITARVRALRVGDPRDPATQIGPVIDDDQAAGIRDLVDRSVEVGAQLLLSGEPGGPAGRVLPPYLLLAGNHAPCAAEEVFGPVATVIRATEEEDALRIANDTEYGLSSAVHTRDAERGVRFARRLRVGMTHVNDSTLNDEANTAFGGEEHSGHGRFGGEWAIEAFTTDHWVSVQHVPRALPFGFGGR
ncbi:aldehyde dehydrogenase family protein [Nocardiopsis sp. CT-R113]|uniref:Aldehyde dehydrogenase family protein n=1 Tax=Nocardiopsis codii TaxID=3065942 RepID=A0ABU7K847_9ACTN|nr:aldehyde dehydrogenase family protein [Nocardiopsis sp. CT-R113]MEE2038410.1 aldehyde dehydrogenase family protein [Nocardiopsis sp. CT-R113]